MLPSSLSRSLETRQANEGHSGGDGQRSDVLQEHPRKTQHADAHLNQGWHDDGTLDLTEKKKKGKKVLNQKSKNTKSKSRFKAKKDADFNQIKNNKITSWIKNLKWGYCETPESHCQFNQPGLFTLYINTSTPPPPILWIKNNIHCVLVQHKVTESAAVIILFAWSLCSPPSHFIRRLFPHSTIWFGLIGFRLIHVPHKTQLLNALTQTGKVNTN